MNRLELAADVMADATSGFVQPGYGLEGLRALEAEGWHIIPPPEVSFALLEDLERDVKKGP